MRILKTLTLHFSAVLAILMAAAFAAPHRAVAEDLSFDAPLFEDPGARGYGGLLDKFIRAASSETVRIRGTLEFPDKAEGPVAAVIIAHTAGGPGPDGQIVQKFLRSQGYATLVYDSYRPRHFIDNNKPGNGGPKLEMNQVVDAYLALGALATHAKIDRTRVAIVGMSAGGNTAILASSAWIKDRYVGATGPRFAALVALYPGGYLLPDAADMTTGSPLLILPAERDDFMKWSRTKVWVDYAKRESPATQLSVVMVPNAYHSFLSSNATTTPRFNPDAPSPNCPFALATREMPSRSLWLDGTVQTKGWDPTCAARGSTTAYSAEAANFALAQVASFLKETFAAAK